MSRFKFLDETNLSLSLTRLYGRAPAGQRIVEAVPQQTRRSLTHLALIGLDGLQAAFAFEGALDGEIFRVYVAQVLAPTLQDGDSVFMDNLAVHKVAGIAELIASRGARLEYLPPYSPDLNPTASRCRGIEHCWAKVKAALRACKARTAEALLDALRNALASISLHDIRAWFAHCGYAVHAFGN